MTPKKWLDKVAYLKFIPRDGIPDEDVPKSWLSKFDDSYITFEGLEDVKYLADREITEQLTHGVGFSPKDKKWYGWRRRAIYGFTIGSACKKGDAHYSPKDKDGFLDYMVNFWSDEFHLNVKGRHGSQEIMTEVPVNIGDQLQKSIPTGEFEDGVYIEWVYSDKIENENLIHTISGVFCPYPELYGKGEWVAETMEDAKQMAIDFNESVS